jgi:hypothetical protein
LGLFGDFKLVGCFCVAIFCFTTAWIFCFTTAWFSLAAALAAGKYFLHSGVL